MHRLIVLLGAWLTAVAFVNSVDAADPTLAETDTNADGKIDRWEWSIGDRVTTVVLDANQDGKPDSTWVHGDLNGKWETVEGWHDGNHDGQYDRLDLTNADGTLETWSKVAGVENQYRYTKTDYRTGAVIQARVSALRGRDFDGVSSRTLPIYALPPKEPLRTVALDGDASATLDASGRLLNVVSKKDGQEITMERFTPESLLPAKIQVREPDTRKMMTLTDGNHDGQYEAIAYSDPQVRRAITADDRNRDGRYDHFMVRRHDEPDRYANDEDFDGVLDHVTLSLGGKRVEQRADQIADRSVPVVPAPPQARIAELLSLLKKIHR